jgi:histone acetyltransferase HTATIP
MSISNAGSDCELLMDPIVGCKLPVLKDGIYQNAEILSIRSTQDIKDASFYVHYESFNKRLDEWVGYEKLQLETIEFPKPKKKPPPKKSKSRHSKASETPHGSRKRKRHATPSTLLPETPGNVDNEESTNTQDGFSKEKEIEKLRTSGSMTQSVDEISRVKNINRICMGKFEVETW